MKTFPSTKNEAKAFCENKGLNLAASVSESARLEFRYFGLGTFWLLDGCNVENYANQKGTHGVDCFSYADIVCEGPL